MIVYNPILVLETVLLLNAISLNINNINTKHIPIGILLIFHNKNHNTSIKIHYRQSYLFIYFRLLGVLMGKADLILLAN